MSSEPDQAEPVVLTSLSASPPGLAVPAAIPPLSVSGLVVTKADLVAALRIYVPLLMDITLLDGDRFLLNLRATGSDEKGGHDG